jgi:hypothetical protein
MSRDKSNRRTETRPPVSRPTIDFGANSRSITGSADDQMPKGGLEPPHPCEYCALNAARLPVSPLRQIIICGGTVPSPLRKYTPVPPKSKPGVGTISHPLRRQSPLPQRDSSLILTMVSTLFDLLLCEDSCETAASLSCNSARMAC